MSTVLDSKVTAGMFVSNLFSKFQGILAGTMSTEDKLAAITKKKAEEVQQLRVQAREAGALMRALADPDTKELEPLEARKARKAKLIQLGGQNIGNDAKLGQIAQEVKALDAQIASDESTYAMNKETYDLAMQNYQKALADYETLKNNGPAIINSMKAYEQAVKQRDSLKNPSSTDVSGIMDQLTGELQHKQAQLRSDKAIDNDLDASHPSTIDSELAAMDAKSIDADIMAQFQAAAPKSTAAAA
jgi:hypothetical protein